MTKKTKPRDARSYDRWLVAGLILVTFAVYAQVMGHEFVNYDDQMYVTENPIVQEGITFHGVVWAFRTLFASNWHPLTWLSHMLDYELFGLDSGGHHISSVLLHLANTLLVYLLLKYMTGDVRPSALVAALFALHPMHVESVAWIAERKDLLSAFFFLLTLAAYTRYTRRPSAKRFGVVALCFALALMAKAMVVTLPFVLLLLDYWPLNRMKIPEERMRIRRFGFLVLEKVPLLLMAVAVSIVTLAAQQTKALMSLERLSIPDRLGNAAASYGAYLVKSIFPYQLAVHYPHPGTDLPSWKIAAGASVLLAITVVAVRTLKTRPYFIVGWLWFLGTLVPVIGLVQAGLQGMADRYTYIPYLGLFMGISWGAAEFCERRPASLKAVTAVAGATLVAFAGLTWTQTMYWKNSIALFSRTVEVTEKNYIAHTNLGSAYYVAGDIDRAENHYRSALDIDPEHYTARKNLGVILLNRGLQAQSEAEFLKAYALNPKDPKLLLNLGKVTMNQGRREEAIRYANEALGVAPDYLAARRFRDEIQNTEAQ